MSAVLKIQMKSSTFNSFVIYEKKLCACIDAKNQKTSEPFVLQDTFCGHRNFCSFPFFWLNLDVLECCAAVKPRNVLH